MESSDRLHLLRAIEQYSLYLLNALIATEKDFTSPTFLGKVMDIVSKANNELSSISSTLKEKLTFIEWDFVERMRNPEEIRRAITENPHKIYLQIRTEVPVFLEKLKESVKNNDNS